MAQFERDELELDQVLRQLDKGAKARPNLFDEAKKLAHKIMKKRRQGRGDVLDADGKMVLSAEQQEESIQSG